MSVKELPPKCFIHILHNKSRADYSYAQYESIFFGFYKSQGYSISDIKQNCSGHGTLLENLTLSEENLNRAQYTNCQVIKANYSVSPVYCIACHFNELKPNDDVEKLETPTNIREELLLNLAQQNKEILDAIVPEKLVALGQNENKDVRIYKEFYNFLIDRNLVKDENILNTLNAIYENNKKYPANIKEIKEKHLTDYLKKESVANIKTLIIESERPAQQSIFDSKQAEETIATTEATNTIQEVNEIKGPITILSSDNEHAKKLLESKYISIKEQDTEYHIYGDSNIEQLYIIPINEETISLITKIAKDNKIRVIAENINIRNRFLKLHKLHIEKYIPLDVICGSVFASMNNLEFKDFIKKYKKLEETLIKSIKPVLSYVTLSTKTSKEIEIKKTGAGFYHTKVTKEEKRDDEYIYEVDIESFIKNIDKSGVTYKEVYHQLAARIQKHNERKIPFEIVELSEKLKISFSKDDTTKHRISELIQEMLTQVNDYLSKNSSAALIKVQLHK